MRDSLAYTSRRFGEISDTIVDIDNALKWGFNWELGPFETWDALGVAKVVEKMKAEGVEPAPWVADMLEAGHETFYTESVDGRQYYDPASKPEDPRWDWVTVAPVRALPFVSLDELRAIPELAGSRLLARGNRLSVLPLRDAEFDAIVRFGERGRARAGP